MYRFKGLDIMDPHTPPDTRLWAHLPDRDGSRRTILPMMLPYHPLRLTSNPT